MQNPGILTEVPGKGMIDQVAKVKDKQVGSMIHKQARIDPVQAGNELATLLTYNMVEQYDIRGKGENDDQHALYREGVRVVPER